MDELEKLKLKHLIEDLKKFRARHTELISIYIPAGADINSVKDQIARELSTAQNIKLRSTRKNVIDALEKIAQELKKYSKTPENGLIIFCGNVASGEGGSDLRYFEIVPPEKLNVRLYRCDQQFVLEPLEELLVSKDLYGVVIVEKGEATIGIVKGKNIEVLWHATSAVPGKMRKGGQSAQRFERQRKLLEKDWYRKIASRMVELFSQFKDLKGIILAGPQVIKESFLNESQLNQEWRKKIIALVDVSYHGEYGINEAINKAKDVLKGEIVEEKNEVNRFFEELAKGGNVVYGYDEVKNCLLIGNVEKVLVSEKIPKEILNEIEELARQCNAEIKVISTDTFEGKQFDNFKVAAFLRYKV